MTSNIQSDEMIEKIRIYYESIEQGANYIMPMVERYLKKYNMNIGINLVRVNSDYTCYSKNIAPIIFWKRPDILITLISDGVEYPLLLIEFCNAVFTEDHELQRMDGLSVSIRNNCCYLKISSTKKKSESGHGGKINFDYKAPYGLYLKMFNKLSFHIEWPLSKPTSLDVDATYLSCPPKTQEIDELFEVLMEFVKNNGLSINWLDEFTKYAFAYTKGEYVRKWCANIRSVTDELIFTDSSRLSKDGDKIILKFNRFGHAMDPERGMLSYYSTIYPKIISKMKFSEENDAWYKQVSKENDIRQYINEHGLKNAYDYLYCFMIGSGLYANEDFKKIIDIYSENKSADSSVINLTEFLNKNYLELNNALRTIFNYSVYFFITDEADNVKVKLVWDKFNRLNDYSGFPKITKIQERQEFDEDDITYISVHNILRPNGYKIIAVSYPGAQGDRAILVEAGNGRRQKRTYIDIISSLAEKVTSLQENKPAFSSTKLQKDIDKLVPFKKQKIHQNALSKTLEKLDETIKKTIKIGIGFWANNNFSADKLKNMNIVDLDYFIYITSDRKKWYIWRTGKDDLFKDQAGIVAISDTFKIVKPLKHDKSQSLKNFL